MGDMMLDFVFDNYIADRDNQEEIEFICTFEGPIPSKSEVLKNLALYFDFKPECAELERFRPVRGKQQIKGRVTINR